MRESLARIKKGSDNETGINSAFMETFLQQSQVVLRLIDSAETMSHREFLGKISTALTALAELATTVDSSSFPDAVEREVGYETEKIELLLSKLDGKSEKPLYKEWQQTYTALARLLPTELLPSKADGLVDDLADIYAKLSELLRRSNTLPREDFLWEVQYGFQSDWGEQAQNSISTISELI